MNTNPTIHAHSEAHSYTCIEEMVTEQVYQDAQDEANARGSHYRMPSFATEVEIVAHFDGPEPVEFDRIDNIAFESVRARLAKVLFAPAVDLDDGREFWICHLTYDADFTGDED